MSEPPKLPGDRRAEGEGADLQAEFEASARAAAERFDAGAKVGHPLAEAQAYYRDQGFPVQMVIPEGGSSVLSYMPERVRLIVSAEGNVIEAYLG